MVNEFGWPNKTKAIEMECSHSVWISSNTNTIKWIHNMGACHSCIFQSVQFKHSTSLHCPDTQQTSKWIDSSQYKQSGILLKIITTFRGRCRSWKNQWIHCRNIMVQNTRTVDQRKYTCDAAELATSNWRTDIWYCITNHFVVWSCLQTIPYHQYHAKYGD